MSNKFHTLKTFIEQKAVLCVHEPAGKLSYHFVTPTYGVNPGADDQSSLPERSRLGLYLQMYDWDACFFSQAATRLNMPDLPRSVLANFLSLMEADGYIPRTISPAKVWDGKDACKPFLCQLLLNICRSEKSLDKQIVPSDLSAYLTKLAQYLCYWEKRKESKTGLYHWRNVLESGVDDNLALIYPTEAAQGENEGIGHFLDGSLVAADLSTYLACEHKAFSRLAELAGDAPLAQTHAKISKDIADKIESLLWCSEMGLYLNLDSQTSEHVHIRSWTAALPALMGVVASPRCEDVIERNLLDEKHFLRPCGISSLAQSEVLYNQCSRGLYSRSLVSNWQGPMWTLPNTMAVRCLIKNGFTGQAQDVAGRVLTTMQNDLAKNKTLHENYNAETGAALWAPQFISWNVLALELIDLFD